MRKLFALLVSVALMVSQAAFLGGAVDSGGRTTMAPKCCGHCGGCKGGRCCMAKGSSNTPQSLPAVPSHGFSQNDLQVLSFVTVQLLPQSASESLKADSNFLIPRALASPLYQRTHSYLL